ncbi:MAG: hypothetical protein ISR82_04455 [Candidatus Marinimicrobia bacterium]|nr:hypothetical protein [Candidatus Neomarinimicrobiota bacterium]MBL7010453.1 hypothetical protein [Candidatus Neomarinimicrobiota bacterium]MBL7030051.1 hypothetical protein [Candidatus Neomarinimicrobiota bacterium]
MNPDQNLSFHRISPLLGLISLLIASCTHYSAFKPIPIGNQSVHPSGKYRATVSIGETTGVGSYLYFDENNDLALHLIYSNRSGKLLILHPEKITMEGISFNGEKQFMEIYLADEYVQKLKSDIAMAQIESTMDNAMESPLQQLLAKHQRYSQNITQYVKNPGAESEIGQPIGKKQFDIEKSVVQTQIMQGIQQPLLIKRPLFPYQYAEGNVMVKYERAISYIITVPLGNEIHTFHFSRK